MFSASTIKKKAFSRKAYKKLSKEGKTTHRESSAAKDKKEKGSDGEEKHVKIAFGVVDDETIFFLSCLG